MAAKIPYQYYYTNNFSRGDETGPASANYAVPMMAYDDVNSPVSVTSFPEQFVQVSSECQLQAVPQMSDMEMGFCEYRQDQSGTGLVPSLWAMTGNYPPMVAPAAKKWPTKSEEAAAAEVKVGRYSVEERRDRILRYLKKRNQRNFNKTIKYACRKTLADKRVRIRGRFAKNVSEISEEEEMIPTGTKHEHEAFHQQGKTFYEDGYQMMTTTTYDEDEWLQTAMDNLVHLPYLGS